MVVVVVVGIVVVVEKIVYPTVKLSDGGTSVFVERDGRGPALAVDADVMMVVVINVAPPISPTSMCAISSLAPSVTNLTIPQLPPPPTGLQTLPHLLPKKQLMRSRTSHNCQFPRYARLGDF